MDDSVRAHQPFRIAADDPAAVARAVRSLSEGRLVALPTETVYGLAADASQGDAVAAIFAAKGRPRFNPLIAHVADMEMAESLAQFGSLARDLSEAFWPGPLTLVLEKRPGAPVHDLVTAGLPTIAIRRPRGIAAAVIAGLGRAIAAPSANRSGRISGTDANAVVADLGASLDLVIDGGATECGVESTIARIEGDAITILRPGAVTSAMLSGYGPVRRAKATAALQAPGMMRSHYAPRSPLRLDAEALESGEALLAFGPKRISGAGAAVRTINLSPSGDLAEAATRLFAALRELDAAGARCIAVEPIPVEGLGEAIADRLSRAAAPRPEDET